MECLREYIGLKGCTSPNPGSALFVNSLPGISMRSLDSLAKQEQKTYLGVWDDIQTRALRKLAVDIVAEFSKRYQIKTMLRAIDLMKRIDKVNNQTAPAAEWRGFAILLKFTSQPIVASNFQMVRIQELSLYVSAIPANPVNVKIFDLDSEEILYTKQLATADLVVGWNRITIDQNFAAQRLYCAYDATEITSVYEDINQNANSLFTANIMNIYGGDGSGYIIGAKTSALSDLHIAQTANSFGLTGIFSVVCKYDQLVCTLKDAFAYPLWYLLGYEAMVERVSSERFNEYTTLMLDDAKDLSDSYLAEYHNSLTQVINGISLDMSDACLDCNAQIQTRESTM